MSAKDSNCSNRFEWSVLRTFDSSVVKCKSTANKRRKAFGKFATPFFSRPVNVPAGHRPKDRFNKGIAFYMQRILRGNRLKPASFCHLRLASATGMRNVALSRRVPYIHDPSSNFFGMEGSEG